MASTPDAAAAQRLGDYDVGGVVREGWGGTIREGHYVLSGRRVTVEQIRHDLAATAGQRERLAVAGRRIAEVHDPHLVALYDLIEDGDRLHLVAEWTDAATLAKLTARRRLAPAAALRVVEDVLDGLVALHAAGVAHGHVTPDTVVVEADGTGRLAELDVAAGTSAGADAAADVRDTARLALDLIHRAGSQLSPVRRSLESALSTSRPTDARTLRGALGAAADSVLGAGWREGQPAPPPAAVRRGWRRWSVRLGALALAAAALGAVLAIVVFGGGGAPRASTTNGRTTPLALGSDAALTVSPSSGGCNTTFVFVGRGSLTGAGPLVYRWEQSDGQVTADTTLTITADEAAFQLTQAWRLQGSQDVPGSMTLHIVKPVDKRLQQAFHYRCP